MLSQVLRVVSRITATVFAGYGLTALVVALLAVLLARAGMARSEAIVSAAFAGFLIYTAVLVWGFSVSKLRNLWAGLLTGSATVYGLLLLAQ